MKDVVDEITAKNLLDKLANAFGFNECLLFNNHAAFTLTTIPYNWVRLYVNNYVLKVYSYKDLLKKICRFLDAYKSNDFYCFEGIRPKSILLDEDKSFSVNFNDKLFDVWKFECALSGIDLHKVAWCKSLWK